MHFFRLVLLFVCWIHFESVFAQLSSFLGTKYLNADTGMVGHPASACWRKTSVQVQTAGIISVPELAQSGLQFSKRFRSSSFGGTISRYGTEFLSNSACTAFFAFKSSSIAAGCSAGFHQYYAKDYYTLHRFQCSLSSTARLLKGRSWFTMDINNLISSSRLIPEDPALQLSSLFLLSKNFRVGLQHDWRNKRDTELTLWKELRWNKHIAHQLFYNLRSRYVTLLLRISFRHHHWQGGTTLFYQPGSIWSCAYSYSF